MKNFEIFQESGDSMQSKKNWYLFGNSRYLGPYSDPEIIQMIEQEKVDGEYKVWSQKIEKWRTISYVPQFKQALESPKSRSKGQLMTSQLEAVPKRDWETSDEFWRHIREQNLFRSEELSFLNEREFNQVNKIPIAEKPLTGAERSHKISMAFSLGILVSVGVVWFLNSHSSPGLSSPSVDFPEVSRQENREIKAVLTETVNMGGPSVAIGLMEKDGSDPSFVIGSNQPDGTRLRIKINGTPESLLGMFRFSSQGVLVVKNGIARSQPLLKKNGKAIPAGEYRVSVLCEACGDSSVLAEKTYFLGGVKNQDYDLKIRQYHESVRQQARSELTEAKQLAETLERELIDLSTQFEAALTQGKSSSWISFVQNWQTMHSQLGVIINRWDAQNNRGDVFYSDIFSVLKQSFEMIGETSQLQSKYIAVMNSKTSGLNELETHISSESSAAQSSLLSLRGKIKMVERLPLSANGMPRTE